jgi:hypothetical protein
MNETTEITINFCEARLCDIEKSDTACDDMIEIILMCGDCPFCKTAIQMSKTWI